MPDEDDACPGSTIDPTISINGCDSGVANPVDAVGCTLADEIDEIVMDCADGARNHGKFASCTAHSFNDLKKDGVITGDNKDTPQSCAGQADLP